jgi:biotin carboxyl carrier protein
MAQFQLRIGDEQREFDVTRQGDRLHVSDHAGGDLAAEVRVLHHDEGQMLLEIHRSDGSVRRVRLVGSRNGDKRQLWIDGRVVAAERVRRRGGGPVADGSLASTIPAVVSQILVAPGDVVEPGDKLLLLESMKMVIPIQAPHAGRVARILCAPGDSVPAGVPLLEIEPHEQ